MLFHSRNFEFKFPRPALVMGVINVTPDSFSDGGKFFDSEKAIAHGLSLVKEGADILDIGGESTRPGAAEVSEEEELRRVLLAIETLKDEIEIPISIDTMKPNVARKALEAGASIVNDVAANRTDPEMWNVVAESRAGYVCMHMQGMPRTMQKNPEYSDIVKEIYAFFEDRLKLLAAAGVPNEQVILDPGIGFGKTIEHNLELIRNIKTFTQLKRPIMLGVSRKSFIGKLFGAEVQDRLPASLACTCYAVEHGANILRVHDVKETMQAMRMIEKLTE